MKYIKTYENLLKGMSEERVLKQLEGKTDNEKIEFLIKSDNIDLYYLLPRNSNGICVYEGDLNLNSKGLSNLPDNLTIIGNFNLILNELEKLPNNLTVNGNFVCNANMLTYLPSDLVVKKDLSITFNDITKLPNNLTINGNFSCKHNRLTSLPDDLIVKGWIECDIQKNDVVLEIPDTLTDFKSYAIKMKSKNDRIKQTYAEYQKLLHSKDRNEFKKII